MREFTFSPETGRVDLLKYDALGWPSVPEKLIGAWQVGVECVDVVADQGIFLLPGAEREILRVSDGPLEAALIALQVCPCFSTSHQPKLSFPVVPPAQLACMASTNAR